MHECLDRIGTEIGAHLQAVIFDFDGTLADSASWFMAQLPQLAADHGFRSPSPCEIDRLRRLPTREVVSVLNVSPFKLPSIAADLRRRAACDASSISLFEGVPEMLENLRSSGVRLAIVSSNAEPNVRAVLGQSGRFVEAYGCGAALFGKASKFRSVLRQLGVPPEHACAVGDEVRDIEAARRAGITAVAVDWGYNAATALVAAQPDVILRAPSEMINFMRARLNRA